MSIFVTQGETPSETVHMNPSYLFVLYGLKYLEYKIVYPVTCLSFIIIIRNIHLVYSIYLAFPLSIDTLV